MSRFVRVAEVEKLERNQHIIAGPSFYEEIKKSSRKRGRSVVIQPNYLREVLAAIALKYMGPQFNVMSEFNISNFVGRPIASDEDVHDIVMEIIEKQHPEILEAYIDFQLKSRPIGVSLIYYTGPKNLATVFIKHGLSEILEKELKKENKKKDIVSESTSEN